MENQKAILILLVIALLISLAFAGMVYWFYVQKKLAERRLRELNKAILDRNLEIKNQAAKLSTAHQKMWEINTLLETEVELRAQRIRNENKQLSVYDHLNSHEVRGPLARILGLIMLMEMEDMSPSLKDLAQKLAISSTELDDVIKRITDQLPRA